MKQPACLLMVVSKIFPEKAWEAVHILNTQACQPGNPEIQGLRGALLVESHEEPGRMIWISIWDRMADLQNFLSSPVYANYLEKIEPYLSRMPEWYRYSILNDWMKNQKEQT